MIDRDNKLCLNWHVWKTPNIRKTGNTKVMLLMNENMNSVSFLQKDFPAFVRKLSSDERPGILYLDGKESVIVM